MERIDVIARAAVAMLAHYQNSDSALRGIERARRLCDALDLEVSVAPSNDVMLGGAYSRLQLWGWDQPGLGGIIWLSEDLDPETRVFAIAHELGHYALHRGEGISLHPPCDQHHLDEQTDTGGMRTEEHRVEEYTPRARREVEANAFAGELLAPSAEVRRLFTASRSMGVAGIAEHFGISRILAQRRLIDTILAPLRAIDDEATTVSARGGNAPEHAAATSLIERLDEWQRAAAQTPGPALVIAGPGTGKTATLVGRVAHLVEERRIPPEKVLALTFSNRAAGEMRERLVRSGLPAARMPIMTIHAFAAALLREYAGRVPHLPNEPALQSDFRILDETDAFLLMEELLGVLPLHFYRSLGNPTAHLRTLLADFSHARDALLTPERYLELVDAMPRTSSQARTGIESSIESSATSALRKSTSEHKLQPGTFTEEQIARARERALAYGVWDRELRRRGLVDFGGLIQRAIELLRADAAVLADVRGRFREVLVDEFQDTNHAAGELLLLISGDSGGGLWAVGDRNQSIYRFRGASPHNVSRLVARYPHVRVLSLRHCYRSVPAIVRLGSAMAARMAASAPGSTSAAALNHTVPDTAASAASSALQAALLPRELRAVRTSGNHPAVLRGEAFTTATHERLGLAAAVEQHRTRGYAYGAQAVLCRTHKHVRQIAEIFTSQGVPISQLGNFFERPEIKDMLMLIHLASGPDARGVLRATPLLAGMGNAMRDEGELAVAARALATNRWAVPAALRRGGPLDSVNALSPAARASLATLGEIATRMRNSTMLSAELAGFLLQPGGYAWRIARVADGIDTSQADDLSASGATRVMPYLANPTEAQQALVALGELVRLALRFEGRWARESDFRARLIRAVTHRSAPRPAMPDSLESLPGTDVAPDTVRAMEHQPADTSPQVISGAPAVRCFLHYVRALRAADATITLPAGDKDAVHVLTLHQSKGLEFPVVYLPGLAQGQFPTSKAGRDEVCPPGFREIDSPGESDAEDRCLLYVGVTRARDTIVLTRAARYGRASRGSQSPSQPSPLLALLDGAPEWADAPALLSEAELAHLAEADVMKITESDDEADEDVAPMSTTSRRFDSAASAASASQDKPRFTLRELEQYHTCPRQYKYARGYGLLDPAEDAVHRFHRYIRRGAQILRDTHAQTRQSDWHAAEARLRALWETDGPAGHAYDAFYWQAAEAILRAEWSAITMRETAGSTRVLLAQPLRAELSRCIVEVTADRVIGDTTSGGDIAHETAASRLTVLMRLHTGRPSEEDKKDLALPLYYIAHQQQHPGVPVSIALAYTGTSLSGDMPEARGLEQGPLEDMTDSARKDAEKYFKPGRAQRSKLDKLDEAALGIETGRFEPRPDERHCPSCAYCYICPADPESGEPQSAPIATIGRAPRSVRA